MYKEEISLDKILKKANETAEYFIPFLERQSEKLKDVESVLKKLPIKSFLYESKCGVILEWNGSRVCYEGKHLQECKMYIRYNVFKGSALQELLMQALQYAPVKEEDFLDV